MKHGEINTQIIEIITILVENGLCDHQVFPAVHTAGSDASITIPNSPNLSIALRDLPYADIYREIRQSESYNIRMLDGGLVQFLFRFEKNEISSHRLSFFPAPMLEPYEMMEDEYEKDEDYGDIVGQFSVRFPLRFDFSSSVELHRDVDHPKCHLTLGQYQGCRIPVNAPLTPFRFMRFILRNFYNPRYADVSLDKRAVKTSFPEVITPQERGIAFLSA